MRQADLLAVAAVVLLGGCGARRQCPFALSVVYWFLLDLDAGVDRDGRKTLVSSVSAILVHRLIVLVYAYLFLVAVVLTKCVTAVVACVLDAAEFAYLVGAKCAGLWV